jgi:sulfatase maturation enzyme AslB (radical SAM superfamily)
MNNNLCVLPFNSLSILSTGVLRACCGSGSGSFDANLNTSPDILNYEQIVDLRKAFLNDEKPAFCNKCWNTEALGSHSDRTVNLQHYKNFQNPENALFQENIAYKNIQYIDIDLGSKCNLDCRMCDPRCSTLVAGQYAKFEKPIINVSNARNMSTIGFVLSDSTKQRVLEVLEKTVNLEQVSMIGGEPLVIDFHDEMLEKIISLGRAHQVSVRVSTNLQSDIERKLELYSHFKKIDLSISVDGSRETYEYIRWPGKWQKIINNINTLKKHNETHNNITYSFTTVVQNLNVDNLHDFIVEIEDLAMSENGPYFHIVQRKNEIEILPKHELLRTITKIKYYKKYKFFYRAPILNILNDAFKKVDNLDPERVKHFFHLQKEFDALRDQNLFKLKPHFIQLAETYNIPTW